MRIGCPVGVLLPIREVATGDIRAAAALDLASLAEEQGYTSVWVGDSLIARPRLEPLSTLAAVAARTNDIAVGTAVILGGLRHPIQLAQQVATVDQLSGGRLVLGVGAGPGYRGTRHEYAALGLAFARRHDRLREVVSVCRRLWSGERFSFHGEFYSFEDIELSPLPARSGGPMVWMGGTGGKALEAEPIVDGWLPVPTNVESFRAWRSNMTPAAQRKDAAAYLTLLVGDDGGPSQSQLMTALETYYGQPYEVIAGLSDVFVGSSAGARSWMEGYVAAGAKHLILRFLGPDPASQMVSMAEALTLGAAGS